MMIKSNYSEYCIKELFNQIPEIEYLPDPFKKKLEELVSFLPEWPNVAHSIYESILFNYFVAMVESKTPKANLIIKKIITLIEILSNSDDFDVRCVAEVSFIEPLLAYLEPTSEIEKYFPKGTKGYELARQSASERYGFNPETWEKRRP